MGEVEELEPERSIQFPMLARREQVTQPPFVHEDFNCQSLLESHRDILYKASLDFSSELDYEHSLTEY